MADNREPPPDLFDVEENLSEEELVDEPPQTEDKDVGDVQETVEVSLDNDEGVADESNEDSKGEPVVTESTGGDDSGLDDADKEPEKPSESSDAPEEKMEEAKSEDKVKIGCFCVKYLVFITSRKRTSFGLSSVLCYKIAFSICIFRLCTVKTKNF